MRAGRRIPASGVRLAATRRPGMELVIGAHKSLAVLGVIGRAEDMHAVMDAERDATLAYLDDVTRRFGGRRGRAGVAVETSGLVFAHILASPTPQRPARRTRSELRTTHPEPSSERPVVTLLSPPVSGGPYPGRSDRTTPGPGPRAVITRVPRQRVASRRCPAITDMPARDDQLPTPSHHGERPMPIEGGQTSRVR